MVLFKGKSASFNNPVDSTRIEIISLAFIQASENANETQFSAIVAFSDPALEPGD